jgi:glycosyltransferase involved in cell wall biosynthesis
MKAHSDILKVARRRPNITFLLAGEGTETLALPNNVRGLGSRKDMPNLYAAADIAISTSIFGEGFSNVIAEAMACGLPVVATNVGDAFRIVRFNGYVISPGDISAIIAGLDQLFLLPESRRHAMGARARERVVQEFSLDRAVSCFDELLLHGTPPAENGPIALN